MCSRVIFVMIIYMYVNFYKKCKIYVILNIYRVIYIVLNTYYIITYIITYIIYNHNLCSSPILLIKKKFIDFCI